jgi:hypothetical protein
VSALAVVVLSGVYTKRAIDKRLAQVHVHEEVEVEEQHFLLGSGSSSGGGAAADGEEREVMRQVVVSVEAPQYVVERSSAVSSREVAAAAYGEGRSNAEGAAKGWVSGVFGGRCLGVFKQKARMSEDEEAGRSQPHGVSRSGSLNADGIDWEVEPCSGHGSSSGGAGDRATSTGGGFRAGKQQHRQQ